LNKQSTQVKASYGNEHVAAEDNLLAKYLQLRKVLDLFALQHEIGGPDPSSMHVHNVAKRPEAHRGTNETSGVNQELRICLKIQTQDFSKLSSRGDGDLAAINLMI